MKANHNIDGFKKPLPRVVVNISSSKNESKSQLGACNTKERAVVVNISSSKNESKSQLNIAELQEKMCCCKYQ
ncbi:hypothetical protein GJJ64_03425 [Pedobacter sp. HX-22-1]|uniref:Uncharacterized protein n=1 Tax=Pedobacter puniceum TaxID=2666136 RepID=A0A7K0FKT4_9SPHI|nr:hypothetical protein [Pedobacter puniceum]MRX46231.1 hypothetical protein [Pedobacter puniceum]